MAESSMNIQKFDGNNFTGWKFRIICILEGKDLDGFIKEDPPKDEKITVGWKRKDAQARGIITCAMDDTQVSLILTCKTSKEIWTALHSRYEGNIKGKCIEAKNNVSRLTMKKEETWEQYLLRAEKLLQEASILGGSMEDEEFITAFIRGLPPKYNLVSMQFDNYPDATISDIRRIFELHEARNKNSKDENAAYNMGHKFNKNFKKNSSDSNRERKPKCFICQKFGHKAAVCWFNPVNKRKENNQGNSIQTIPKQTFSKYKQYPSRASLRGKNHNQETAMNLHISSPDFNNKCKWILDSGATSHMSTDINLIDDLQDDSRKITLPDDRFIKSNGSGTVETYQDDNHLLTLKEVLYVPELNSNLISVSKITEDEKQIIFDENGARIIDNNGSSIITAKREDNIYTIDACANIKLEENVFKTQENNWKIWHKRLAHINENYMNMTLKDSMVYGFSCSPINNLEPCITCIQSKFTRLPFKEIDSKQSTKPLDLVHMDLIGLFQHESIGRAIYVRNIVDDLSRKIFPKFLKSKLETFAKLKEFIELIENIKGTKIKRISGLGNEKPTQRHTASWRRGSLEELRERLQDSTGSTTRIAEGTVGIPANNEFAKSAQLKDIDRLTFSILGVYDPNEDDFEIFIQRFNAACTANETSEHKKVVILLSLLDSGLLKLGNDLFFTEKMEAQTYELIVKKIRQHLEPKKKLIPQRCLFLKRTQRENESVSEYLRELKHLASNCAFGEMLEMMLRDRFVAGLTSESLQKRLLQEDDDVKLERVFALAVSYELAEKDAKELHEREVARKNRYVQEQILSLKGETEAKVTLTLDGNVLKYVVDTGSPVTLMPKTIFKKFWKVKLFPTSKNLKTLCNNPIKIVGERDVFVEEAGKKLRIIVVDEGSKSAFCYEKKKVEDELEDMVDKGILEPLDYADWAAPIVPVLKKDGARRIRICGDFRSTANKAIILDKYPLPTIDEIFSKLSGSTVFSTLDLSMAYLQVELAEAKGVVNINTTKGLLAYKRLPYGVAVAPNKFQRLMDNIFADIPGVACYIDDILVSGRDANEHKAKLELVFKRLEDKGLKLNKNKCRFAVDSVEYLGFRIDKNGLHPLINKIQAVSNAPEPKNIGQLRLFIGMLMYYARFIENISHILTPFYKLLKKNTRWKWTREHRILFNRCESLLTNESVLTHYDPTKELVLACDASSYGLGVLEKEALSIVYGCEKFRQYLLERSFVLVTDNRPLMHLFSPHKPIPVCAASRIKRWSLKLGAFHYSVEFRKTDDHGNADALSRLPLKAVERESIDEDQVLLLRKMNEVPFSFRDVAFETRRDKILSIVLRNVREDNWQVPKISKENPLFPFYKIRNELSADFGCLQWRERIVIPPKLRSQILRDLNEMHFGIVKMKMIARRYFWWPGIDGNIEDMAGNVPSVRNLQICLPSRFQNGLGPKNPGIDYIWIWPALLWFKTSLRKNSGKDSLETNLERFLLAQRAFPQTVIKESPAELLMKRRLKTRFSNLMPKMEFKGEAFHDALRKQENFNIGSDVYFRNYAAGPKWKLGTILKLLSCRHYLIGYEDQSFKRHINQLRPVKEKPEAAVLKDPRLVLPSTSTETLEDHPEMKPSQVGLEIPERQDLAPVEDNQSPIAASGEKVPSRSPRPQREKPRSTRQDVAPVGDNQSPVAASGGKVPSRSPRPQRSRRPPDRIFVGYSNKRKAFRIWDPKNYAITETRDVSFIEKEKGAELLSNEVKAELPDHVLIDLNLCHKNGQKEEEPIPIHQGNVPESTSNEPDGGKNVYNLRPTPEQGFYYEPSLSDEDTSQDDTTSDPTYPIQTLIAFAAMKNLHIHHFDIETAFLYGKLEETIYMSQPKGFEYQEEGSLLVLALTGQEVEDYFKDCDVETVKRLTLTYTNIAPNGDRKVDANKEDVIEHCKERIDAGKQVVALLQNCLAEELKEGLPEFEEFAVKMLEDMCQNDTIVEEATVGETSTLMVQGIYHDCEAIVKTRDELMMKEDVEFWKLRFCCTWSDAWQCFDMALQDADPATRKQDMNHFDFFFNALLHRFCGPEPLGEVCGTVPRGAPSKAQLIYIMLLMHEFEIY
ncbi:K02A2.6-like [Cordylochernes scorpioides]|uniref:RNA-directed DNA polymerase n=1 Tax=Cordylochernes scorpioides TaxID=51811 RepID=A0ABY6KRT9_9ARAC|nr:K02A2.6-like [Cordylochernes scorpioides]